MNQKLKIIAVLLLVLSIAIILLSSKKEPEIVKEKKEEIMYIIKEHVDGEVECISQIVKEEVYQSINEVFRTREDCLAYPLFKEKAKIYNEKLIAKRAANEKKAQEEAKIKEKKYNYLLTRFKKTNDKIENVSFYEHKSNLKRDNEVKIYIGKSSGNKWLRFEANYHANSWLFIESFILYVDGESFSQDLKRDEIERDSYSTIWETIQLKAEGDLLFYIQKIPDSNESIIRYKGKYNSDKKISEREKKAIKETLELYELL